MNNINSKVISNEKPDEFKIKIAEEIISELQSEIPKYVQEGAGPFIAAIYDKDGNLIVKAVNSVFFDKCSNNHAEINAIKAAEQVFNTHDLSPSDLSIYVTAEPCMMCLGAIMWSGIKNVYYGVPSDKVEKITGFDEGFKPRWLDEFKKRGITVYGNIASELGETVLRDYVNSGNIIYKPERSVK